MNTYIINEKLFMKLYKVLNTSYCFETDGCDCGEFNFQLEKNIYIHIDRSCRKSSSTPNGMQWKVNRVELSKKVVDDENVDRYYKLEDLELVDYQKKEIESLARLRSIKDIGYDEYGNEYDKWNELKEYVLSEKEKNKNSDDIPKSIYEDILNKMKELEKK